MLGTTNRLAAVGYNASGNMTAWGNFSFAWDALDRMTALVGNGLARRFAYTADGERVLEREGSSYRFSLRGLDNRVLREMKATWTGTGWSWAWEKDSIWGAGRLVASVSATEGIRHAHVDHLGSPRLLTNRCGQRLALLNHNPWGLDRPAGNQHTERHRFTAHQRDLGFLDRTWDDFDDMHARIYTPYLGRFVSVDPGRDNNPNAPQSWNLFAYVRNNPVSSTDPDGTAAAALARALEAAIDKALTFVDANTTSNAFGILVLALANTLGDIAKGTTDLLKIGEATGAAIGSGAGTEDLVAALAEDAGRAGGLVLMMAVPAASATQAATQTTSGTLVYRVWGDDAGPWGRSWTTTNPGSLANYRNVAGLPRQNTGRFVSEPVINDVTGISVRRALPLHGNQGGLVEVLVPNPQGQLTLVRVSGVNPPF